MDINEFKSFIKTIPAIKDDVIKGKYTWQQLYEVYVLYGEDDEIFEYYKKKKSYDFNNIIKAIQYIDLDSLSHGLDGIVKILDIINQFIDHKPKENDRVWYDD